MQSENFGFHVNMRPIPENHSENACFGGFSAGWLARRLGK
jgi:hypothetical protein